jgi:cytochrome P450
LYHKIRGTYYREVLDMFETYGPIVRVAPDELAFSHADAWKDIYGLLPGRKQNRKDFNVWPPRQKGWSRTLPLASDLVNSLLRRNAAPAFSPTAVREQEHTLVKYVDQLTARLREAANSAPSGTTSQNMCEWFDFLTVDITGEIGFSERLHCIEHARLHPWIKTIIASLSIGTMLSQVNRSGVVSMVQAVVPERILSHLNKPAKHAGMVVQRRLQRERESAVPVKDIFTTFLSFGQHGRALDRSELESNATFLIMGGGDTVAALLSGAMWFLCTRKDALRRLQQELRLAFETSQGINLEVLSGLKYLTAVINECLRMLPPIPEGTPRIVSTEGGQNIAGRWTPEGTSVAIPTWAANRCGENFHKPHEFLPERWLGEVTKGIGDNLSASQPFSTGPRYCIGVK